MAEEDEDGLLAAATAYAFRHGAVIADLLGTGIHGRVCVLERTGSFGRSALKVFRDPAPYQREKACYERLRQAARKTLRGFRVPQLLGSDNDLLALELTVVQPPYVLDFAGAYPASPPEFSEEIWADWETHWREVWGERWEVVESLLAELRSLDIYYVDPSPSNVRFA